MNTYDLFKKIAFQLDPELAHTQSMKLLSHSPESLATFMGAHENLEEDEFEPKQINKSEFEEVWTKAISIK